MKHFLCPVCNLPLIEKDTCASCERGHLFDKAKEGYFYLLTPEKRGSKDPGDNKEMISARRDFLDGQYYAPLAERIAQIINKRYPQGATIVDAGTGSGFYLSKIINSHKEFDDEYFAIDISKHAVRISAKRNKVAHCAVASVFNIPLEDKCADIVVCVFSPYAMEEYSRILKDDGILIVAYPCEKHLIQLRTALYENVREVATTLPQSDFISVDEEELSYRFELGNKDICNLLTMTPYVYRAPKEAIDKLKRENKMAFTADFHINVLKKSIH